MPTMRSGRTADQDLRATAAPRGPTTVYNYDEVIGGTIPNGVGHLTSIAGGGVGQQFAYDEVGRPVATTRSVDDVVPRSEAPYYDPGGRVALEGALGGRRQGRKHRHSTSQWTYDAAGRLLTIPGVQTGATYTADGQSLTQSRPNGVTTTNTYQASRLWLTGNPDDQCHRSYTRT